MANYLFSINSTTLLGNTVNICCIGPNSSEFEDSYYIFTRSQISKLKFESLAKNIQHITLATLSSEFLVIPVGSSEPLKLEICITPHKVPHITLPLMLFFLLLLSLIVGN
jgi:hypothetical protein